MQPSACYLISSAGDAVLATASSPAVVRTLEQSHPDCRLTAEDFTMHQVATLYLITEAGECIATASSPAVARTLAQSHPDCRLMVEEPRSLGLDIDEVADVCLEDIDAFFGVSDSDSEEPTVERLITLPVSPLLR